MRFRLTTGRHELKPHRLYRDVTSWPEHETVIDWVIILTMAMALVVVLLTAKTAGG